MRRLQILVYFTVLGLITSGISYMFFSDRMLEITSCVFLLVILALPLCNGMALYDFVDKILDEWWEPNVKIPTWIHLVTAVLLAINTLLVWPTLTQSIVLSEHLLVGNWLSYLHMIDTSPGLNGIAAFAWNIGLWAAISTAIGYLFEMAFRWWVATRHKTS